MDDPYSRYSNTWDPRVGPAAADFDPNDIEDDGDDGLASHDSRRRSVLSFGRHSSHGILPGAGAGAVAAGGAAAGAGTAGVAAADGGGFKRTLSRLVPGRNGALPVHAGSGNNASGQYGPVPGSAGMGMDGPPEKSEWLSRQKKGNKKMRWLVGIILGILLIGAIVGGIVGGVLASRRNNNSNGSSRSRSSSGKSDKGELNNDSSEIKELLGNSKLRRVFPGMDYTPLNAQYPACLSNMPRQNEVTKDVAVMSQLTNRIRLYGTDCNQTEMVLHAIDTLDLKDDTKVWLGVWQDKNTTTNARQLEHMYTLLDKYGADRFAGAIVGNEVLFREDMTLTELATILRGVKSNFTSKKIDLPVATSDLGDDWTKELTAEVDIVMSNVHPFFAGKTAEEATGWTWNFWQTKDVVLTKDDPSKKQIISEVGWPSGGGKSCGDSPACTSSTPGSIAGINEMNKFMEDFVCQGLNNGTEFFW